MSEQNRYSFRSLLILTLFLIVGFVGGSLLLNNDSAPDRPFFTEDVARVQPQTVAFDEVEQAQDGGGTITVSDLESRMSSVYDRVSPSVVSIRIEREAAFMENGSSGSGFVYDQQGRIITNYHVVQGADEIIVNFLDGTIVRAEVVGLDADSDLAVIRVDVPTDRLFPVTFGNERELNIGQMVVAIGSPFQQNWTMTSGIVSALNRDIRGLGQYNVGSVIQTDAPINPGNSGGPLLNLDGEVVGVNSQIISRTQSNSGIGFAIPANLTSRVAQELIDKGTVEYSFIGISGLDININLIEAFNLPNNQRGLPIGEVTPGSPAAESGLRSITENRVDIITAINGEAITNFSTLIGYLAEETRPGDTVMLSVIRGGERFELPLTLSTRPD